MISTAPGAPHAAHHAASILLGRIPARLDEQETVPAALRPRAARRSAIDAIVAHGDVTATLAAALIRSALKDDDPYVRAHATRALALTLEPEVSVPVLLACTTDGSKDVRAAAREALDTLSPERSARTEPERHRTDSARVELEATGDVFGFTREVFERTDHVVL
jgi:HEAT repeat protein